MSYQAGHFASPQHLEQRYSTSRIRDQQQLQQQHQTLQTSWAPSSSLPSPHRRPVDRTSTLSATAGTEPHFSLNRLNPLAYDSGEKPHYAKATVSNKTGSREDFTGCLTASSLTPHSQYPSQLAIPSPRSSSFTDSNHAPYFLSPHSQTHLPQPDGAIAAAATRRKSVIGAGSLRGEATKAASFENFPLARPTGRLSTPPSVSHQPYHRTSEQSLPSPLYPAISSSNLSNRTAAAAAESDSDLHTVMTSRPNSGGATTWRAIAMGQSSAPVGGGPIPTYHKQGSRQDNRYSGGGPPGSARSTRPVYPTTTSGAIPYTQHQELADPSNARTYHGNHPTDQYSAAPPQQRSSQPSPYHANPQYDRAAADYAASNNQNARNVARPLGAGANGKSFLPVPNSPSSPAVQSGDRPAYKKPNGSATNIREDTQRPLASETGRMLYAPVKDAATWETDGSATSGPNAPIQRPIATGGRAADDTLLPMAAAHGSTRTNVVHMVDGNPQGEYDLSNKQSWNQRQGEVKVMGGRAPDTGSWRVSLTQSGIELHQGQGQRQGHGYKPSQYEQDDGQPKGPMQNYQQHPSYQPQQPHQQQHQQQLPQMKSQPPTTSNQRSWQRLASVGGTAPPSNKYNRHSYASGSNAATGPGPTAKYSVNVDDKQRQKSAKPGGRPVVGANANSGAPVTTTTTTTGLKDLKLPLSPEATLQYYKELLTTYEQREIMEYREIYFAVQCAWGGDKFEGGGGWGWEF
ncbi:uncharacterized protein EV422DRAFT_104423 [Fimicolochytrium jonesii]|uniref:uncharacterized protein n=1 Tax=Fimicolochytrium jonesii TaxID=1396493 RepID=UPI0022FDB5FC|nr:uncharacterized protein EV422DRAFT_104423 [Fimicolochytrium jonesii]KAI8819719.1 hypothetical protein EV422DRAFT_104423 [Fimicolochytrium jonesii]